MGYPNIRGVQTYSSSVVMEVKDVQMHTAFKTLTATWGNKFKGERDVEVVSHEYRCCCNAIDH